MLVIDSNYIKSLSAIPEKWSNHTQTIRRLADELFEPV